MVRVVWWVDDKFIEKMKKKKNSMFVKIKWINERYVLVNIIA